MVTTDGTASGEDDDCPTTDCGDGGRNWWPLCHFRLTEREKFNQRASRMSDSVAVWREQERRSVDQKG